MSDKDDAELLRQTFEEERAKLGTDEEVIQKDDQVIDEPDEDIAEGQDEEIEEELGGGEEDIDPLMEQAMAKGWRPKEEFAGEPHQWVDYTEFLNREPLFDTIRALKKKTAEQDKALQKLNSHYNKVEEQAFERAMATLRAQKAYALEQGDHDTVMAIDEEMMDRKLEAKQQTAAPVQNEPGPLFQKFVEENPWYNTDTEAQIYADMMGDMYAKQNPDASSEDIYAFAAQEAKHRFADRLVGKPKPKPRRTNGAVDSGTSRRGGAAMDAGKPKAKTFDDLPSDAKQVAMMFHRTVNDFDVDKYVKDYFAIENS